MQEVSPRGVAQENRERRKHSEYGKRRFAHCNFFEDERTIQGQAEARQPADPPDEEARAYSVEKYGGRAAQDDLDHARRPWARAE